MLKQSICNTKQAQYTYIRFPFFIVQFDNDAYKAIMSVRQIKSAYLQYQHPGEPNVRELMCKIHAHWISVHGIDTSPVANSSLFSSESGAKYDLRANYKYPSQ